MKPGGTGAVSPKILKNLKLSLRGVLRDKLNIAGSAEEAEDRIGLDRSVRPSA